MKLNLLTSLLFISLISAGISRLAIADIVGTETQMIPDQYTKQRMSPDQYEKLNLEKQKSLAAMWGLSIEDYDHYLALMQNTVNGAYYKNANLDPSWILGFNANNDQDREKYAIIAIRNERVRVARELAFQKAFQQLQFELYPNEKPISTSNSNKNLLNNSIIDFKAGDSLLLFVNVQSPSINPALTHLISFVQTHPTISLNVYLVNATNDNDIRHWALQQTIPQDLVKNNIITLNYDKGRFAKLSQGKNQLPLLLLNHQGRFEIISWNSIG